MGGEIRFHKVIVFDWDDYNREKNKLKHNVTHIECEEIFLKDAVYFEDEKHSKTEQRYTVYGETTNKRSLTIVFTVRTDRIRIISARDQSKKEREVYKKFKENL